MERYNGLLLQIIGSYTPLSSVSTNALLGNTEILCLERRKNMIRQDRNDRYEYFILEGLARRYVLSDKGIDVTTGFYYPCSVVMPNSARTIGNRSIFSIESVTELVIARLPVVAFDHLRNTYPDLRQFGQQVVERELSKSIMGQTVFRTCTAKQRLQMMRQEFPNLENLVPHQFVASYLGVTPVSFSRLRSELALSR